MIEITDDKYKKLLSIRMFLDQNFFEIEDPFDLKKILENIGLFSDGELSRALLFNKDRNLSKGNSSSATIRKKIHDAIKSKNVSTVRFMQDENHEIDDQSYIEIYNNNFNDNFRTQLHILVSNISKHTECQIAIADCISKYDPQYAFANLYVLDHFDSGIETGVAEIDLINEQYPVDSMNINKYQGLATNGKIKDAQWINYFNARYLSNIIIPNAECITKMHRTEFGTYLQVSDTPFFSPENLDWIYKFRRSNGDNVVLR